jgi:hypothetical protein
MSDKESFANRKKGLEEEYFRKKEQELIEKMRRRAELETERREIAEAAGTTSEEILDDLQELGYTRETVERLLHLVPLVQVAWAEGHVTKRERERILEVAGLRGVAEGTPAHQQLTAWLDRRPSDEFFEKTLRIIRHLMQAMFPRERAASRNNLVSYCLSVAAASGGLLGLGNKVSDKEQEVLERIAAELEREHQEAARQVYQES